MISRRTNFASCSSIRYNATEFIIKSNASDRIIQFFQIKVKRKLYAIHQAIIRVNKSAKGCRRIQRRALSRTIPDIAPIGFCNRTAITLNQGILDFQIPYNSSTSTEPVVITQNRSSIIGSYRIKQSIPRPINGVMVSVEDTSIAQPFTFKRPPEHFMFRGSQRILTQHDVIHQYCRSIFGIIEIPVQFVRSIDGIIQTAVLSHKLVNNPIIAIPHLKLRRVGFLFIHNKRGFLNCFRILGIQSCRIFENMVLAHRLSVAIKPPHKIMPFHGNWDSQIVKFSLIISVGASNKHTIIKSYAENFLVTVFLEVRIFARNVRPFSFDIRIINIFIQATSKFTLFHIFGRHTFTPHFTWFSFSNTAKAFYIRQKVLVVIAMLNIRFRNTRKRTRYGIAFYLARNVNHIFKIMPARNPSRNTTGNLTGYFALVFCGLSRPPCYNTACDHGTVNRPLVDRSHIGLTLPQNSSGKITIDTPLV